MGSPNDRSRLRASGPVLRAIAASLLAACMDAAGAAGVPSATHWDAIAAACRTGNPYYVTTRWDFGGTRAFENAAVVAFRDTLDSTWSYPLTDKYLTLAAQRAVGTTWGLAYDWRRGVLYVGGFFKQYGLAMPPDTPTFGRVHRLDLRTGEATVLTELPADGDLPGAAFLLGTVGLGDLDLDASGETLFAVNLLDRRIYRLSTTDGRVLGTIEHGAIHEPWAANARPFGLGFHDGRLYHGVVDSRADPDLPGELAAYLYRSRPDGSDMEEAARVSLDYARPDRAAWVPWSPWPRRSPDYYTDSEPILVDIAFRPNGDPILGLGDRKQIGDFDTSRGDVLPTIAEGSGRWRALTEPEHYADDFSGSRPEALQGQLAAVPGRDAVVTIGLLSDTHPGGGWWFDNRSGDVRGPANGVELLFGEEMFSGDIEVLCDPDSGPGRQLFLPIASAQGCVRRAAIDAVLVLDMSTSMRQEAAPGLSKGEAVVQAAALFADIFASDPRAVTGDRIGVVGFNQRAWTQLELTTDRAAAFEAIEALPARIAEGTRLDLALVQAAAVLQGARARPVTASGWRLPLVILLTDGLPNRVPPAEDGSMATTVLRAASSLKAAGAIVHTVGFGDGERVDPALLRAVASRPEEYHHAPSVEDLFAIYEELAIRLHCP